MIEFRPLFYLQDKLDKRIMSRHEKGMEGKELISKKSLAFKVELAELLNETRIFKYWSQKPPSDREVILEEYADGLHFGISLMIDKGLKSYQYDGFYDKVEPLGQEDIEFVFDELFAFDWVTADVSRAKYAFELYIKLGFLLGFTWDEIRQAYVNKNMINHDRQENNY